VFGAKIRFRKFSLKKLFSNGILLEINLAATFSGIVRKRKFKSQVRKLDLIKLVPIRKYLTAFQ